jgi:hypothetical protein
VAAIEQGGGGSTAEKPTVYWFKGKPYYSLRAYQHAVQAANQRRAAQQAAAKPKPKPARPAVVRLTPEQQRMIERQTQRLREQEIADARRRQAAAAQREALRLRAQQARALLSQRAEEQRILLARQAAARKRLEQGRVVAQRRHAAYDEIQRRHHEQLVALQQSRLNRQIDAEYDANAARLRDEAGVKFRAGGSFLQTGGPGHGLVVHRMGQTTLDRQRVLEVAKRTGNYEPAVDLIDRQSKQTGGRYVDPDLWRAVTEGLVRPVTEIGQRYTRLVSKVNDLIEAGRWDAALGLYRDKRFDRLRDLYAKWYGDPFAGEGGAFAPLADKLAEADKRRQALVLRESMGLSPLASDEEVTATLRRAYQDAYSYTGGEAGDIRRAKSGLAPLTAEERMGRYLDHLSAVERQRVQQQLERQTQMIKQARAEGYINVGFTEDGRFVAQRPEAVAALAQAREVVPGFDAEVARLQRLQHQNPAAYEQELRAFMSRLGDAWYAAHPVDQASLSRDRTKPQRGSTGRGAFLDEVARAMFGRPWTGFDDFSTGFVGGITQTVFGVASAVPALFRNIMQSDQGFGSDYVPYLDIHLWGDEAGAGFAGQGSLDVGPVGIKFGRVFDQNKEEAQRLLDKAFASGDLGQIGEALRQYSQWGEGNAGGLLTQLVDPFQFMDWGGSLVKPGALALARSGGLRAAASEPGRLLADYFRLVKRGPGAMSGEWARLKLAQGLGVPYHTIKDASEEEWSRLARDFLDGKAKTEMADSTLRMLEGSSLSGEQLLSQGQVIAQKVAKEFGLTVADPAKVARFMQAAERAVARSEARLEEARSLVRTRAAAQRAARALEKERALMPGPAPAVRKVVPRAGVIEHERLIREFVSSSEELARLGERTRSVLDRIDALGRAPSVKRTAFNLGKGKGDQMAGLQRELFSLVRQMRRLDEQIGVNPAKVTKSKARGVITRQWAEVQRYRNEVLKVGDPKMPSLPALRADRIKSDRAWLKTRIKGLQTALAQATTPAQRKDLRRLLDNARAAQRGLDFEEATLKPRRAAAVFARKHRDRVAKAVRPQQIGAVATTRAQRLVETVRSLNVRLANVDEVTGPAPLSRARRAAVDAARPLLEGQNVAALVRRFGFDLGDDISLFDAVFALRRVDEVTMQSAEYAGVWRALRAQVVQVMRQVKWRGTVRQFLDVFPEEHMRVRSPVIGLRQLSALDKEIAEGLEANVRGFRAEGLIRRGKRRIASESPTYRLLKQDADPRVVAEKMRILRRHGLSLWQYDEARAAIGPIMLQRRGMAQMARAALQRARRTGETLEAAMAAVRDERALNEAMREFEEWSVRPEMQGLTPETVMRVFEEDYISRGLGYSDKLSVTAYQQAVLTASFEEVAGFSPSETHLLARYLRGDLEAMPPGVRAPRHGEFIDFESGARIYVMDATHPYAQNIPFGARPRFIGEEGVDEAASRAALSAETLAEDAYDRELIAGTRAMRDALDTRRADVAARRYRPGYGKRPAVGWHLRAAPEGWEANKVGFFGIDGSRFAGPEGEVAAYKRWLWDMMLADEEFRAEVKALRGKGLVSADGLRAGVLADAVNWAWSEDGLRYFAHGEHAARLGAEAVSHAAEVARIAEELGTVEGALKVAREIAGDRFIVRPGTLPAEWLDRVVNAAEEAYAALKRKNAGSVPAAQADRLAALARWLRGDEVLEDISSFGDEFHLVKRGEAVPASVMSRFDDLLREAGIDTFDEVMGYPTAKQIKAFPKRYKGALARPVAEWAYNAGASALDRGRVIRLEAKAAALREELGAARKAKVRRRGLVGISIAGDGVYIREGTSNVTVAHEIMHQFYDDPANALWAGDLRRAVEVLGPDVRSELWSRIRIGRQAYDEAELLAELYALWRVGDDAGSDILWSWRDLRGFFGAELDPLERLFTDYAPQITAPSLAGLKFPPFGNRALMYRWLVDNGYWSKRLGEQIAAGERVWSVAEERRFFETHWAYTPPWTDPVLLKPLLNDREAMRLAFRSWGFEDGAGFEQLVASADLTPKQVAKDLAWGGEGVSRHRTIAEMRRYAIERYGELVSADGRNLDRMPWLMRADDEYLTWLGDSLDKAGADAYRAAREGEWAAARDLLPAGVRDVYFEGGVVKAAGLQLDRGLVKAKEVASLNRALEKATRRRLERMRALGDVDPRVWLPQEQMEFAYDVVNELMVDRRWRGLLGGTPVLGTGLHLWGQFWRMLVSWQPAFPIMNLIETYGFKRAYLQIYHNGFRPLGWDREGADLVRNLREIGAESASVFNLRHGVDSFSEVYRRVGDETLPINIRGGAVVQGVTSAPVLISKIGEDRLRLQFARSVAGNTYRTLRKEGMGEEAAGWLARAEAKRLVNSFFAIGASDSGLSAALNHLVPFFSYNFKNKTLALRIVAENPMVWVWGERFKRDMERQNRERWAREHPGLPFPESPEASGMIWFTVDGTTYQVDLSNFSDWSRAIRNVTQDKNAIEWGLQFFRVPHPSQDAFFKMIFGGETLWGKPATPRELSIWVDFFYWLHGNDYAGQNWDWRRSVLQMTSQMLFFQAFGSITPIKVQQMTYFHLRDLDEAAARAYLERHPELLAYWASKRRGDKPLDPSAGISRWDLLSDAERSQYQASMHEWEALNNALDARIARYAAEPWSEEYRAAKREAFIVRRQFLAEHPELADYWTMYMSPADFASFEDRWKTDSEVEAFLGWRRPERAAYGSDLAYQRALVEYYQRREDYLRAHPAVMKALYGGKTALERVWHDQELQWSETLEMQARIQVRILEEQRRGAKADRDLVDILYSLKGDVGLLLDTDRYAVFDSGVSRFSRIPGFGRFVRMGQTLAERRAGAEDLRYARGIGAVVAKATDGKSFYELLRRDPWLLREYWRRNPEAKAKYEAGQEYFRWISQWVSHLQRDDFDGAQSVWDSMPAWVKDRYFAGHPDSKMRDGMGAAAGQGGLFFSSPEAKQRFLDGQAYYAALGRWIKLLEAKDYRAADRYFRGLPEWMREKYFAKHPDQRAKAELDQAALRAAAEYFLASGDDKLKILRRYPALREWLRAHGGEEEAHRGLIAAIYAAIPSSEPWLKRTFRERFPEIFSQEAAGQRRLDSVAADLARNPEALPFFRRAVRLQYALYFDQLKRSKVQPKPWVLERKTRLKKRRKRRAAAFSSLWGMHQATRKYQYVNAGRERSRP